MKKAFLFLAIIIQTTSFNTMADQENKFIKSSIGNIEYSKIETVLSEEFNTVVEVESTRWPYYPSAYTNYIFGKANNYFFGSENFWETYVINLTFSHKNKVSCDLIIFLYKDKITLDECDSTAIHIGYRSFSFSDFDLKPNFGTPTKD